LVLRGQYATTTTAEIHRGLYIDLETTGLDSVRDEVIEVAMVPFGFGSDGQIFDVGEPFQAFRQPSISIPPLITQLTGIDDNMVAGKTIDPAAVTAYAAPASLVIAHNAAFDRKFAERFSSVFQTKAWACSMSQVDWQGNGFSGTKLAYLAAEAGFFYDRHRAVHDCQAAIALLATPLPNGALPMAELLERTRRSTVRIWAEHSPFELKDTLKARGYRWNADAGSAPRAWYIDVDEGVHIAEIEYLAREIYQREFSPLTRKLTAFDRFSDRI
jgi:DNA polymerase-3 subunit epsilon